MNHEDAAVIGAIALAMFLSVSLVVGMGAYGFVQSFSDKQVYALRVDGDCEISGETIRPIKLIAIRDFNARNVEKERASR